MARVRFSPWKKIFGYIEQGFNVPVLFKKYLNFGSTTGESGYGIRDENGNIQVKNLSGSWTDIPTTSGAVDSVNGQTGVVTIDLQSVTDEGATTTNSITAQSFITTGGISDITRDVNGYIEEVEYAGGRTITVSRTGNFITSKTDGVNTWTYNRDGNNRIISVTVV
jgi:YD repeat-containing protein